MFTDEEEKYEKQRLRMFWTNHWCYGKIDTWMNLFHEIPSDSFQNGAHQKYYYIKRIELFKDALIKMIFERRLTRDEASSLFDMIKSNDKESLFLALTIMQQKKHTIFLKK